MNISKYYYINKLKHNLKSGLDYIKYHFEMILLLFQAVSSSFYRMQFQQKLNHYDTHTNEYFNQTFLTDLLPNITRNSILIVLGEFSGISKDMANSTALLELKQRTNSRIIILEHRFFGNSLPTDGFKKRNRNYLMVHQALADISYFLDYVRTKFCTNSNCNIGLIGSGYAGSLAAWSRVRYPHLTIGVWASSAPLYMVSEFPYYDEFHAEILGNKCLTSTKKVLDQIENIIEKGDKKSIDDIKKLFGFQSDQDNISILYSIAEVLSLPLRQPNPSNLINQFCSQITKDETIDKLSEFFKSFLKEFNKTVDSFNLFSLTNNPDLRSHLWLQCNQIGWFHTSSGKLRSKFINHTFFDRVCQNAFDIDVSNSTISNAVFGGIDPYLSNAIFTNGDKDPYSILSVQKEVESMGRLAFKIKDSGPSADFCSNETDSNNKKTYLNANSDALNAQSQCVGKMSEWINQVCEKNCKQGTCILSNCVCDDMWDGEFCNSRTHTYTVYTIISAVCIVAPTLILLFFGMFVLFCGTKEDAEIDNSRKTYFT